MSLVRLSAALFLLLASQAMAGAPERVSFPSNDATATPLTGFLYRPSGAGPFPAVVALHGCNGLLGAGGNPGKREADWAERLTAAGYAVLFPDSFNPRGVRQVCTVKQAERPVQPRGRSFDAAGAADWLAAQPFIDKHRLALMGWSHGGSTVLWTVRSGAAPRLADFKTAVAFYPGCRVPLERAEWRPRLPLKILIGAVDDWTPPAPCRELAAKHGASYIEYPGAYHAFDTPNAPVRERKGLTFTANGSGVAHVGTNQPAREAAIREVMATFAATIGLKP